MQIFSDGIMYGHIKQGKTDKEISFYIFDKKRITLIEIRLIQNYSIALLSKLAKHCSRPADGVVFNKKIKTNITICQPTAMLIILIILWEEYFGLSNNTKQI